LKLFKGPLNQLSHKKITLTPQNQLQHPLSRLT